MKKDTLALPEGFLFSGMHAGIKKKDKDLALIYSHRPCTSAAVFTKNHFPGEPVKLAKEKLARGNLQMIVVNSGISNVATGKEGYKRAVEICRQAAEHMKLDPGRVVISSTGVIGWQYPDGVIEKALPKACRGLGSTPKHFKDAARAIMTTDTIPKFASRKIGKATLSMMVKGAGMIAPNMATMLAFGMTDAKIPKASLQAMLGRCVEKSFNCMSVDTDTSTSDSVFLQANGQHKVNLNSFEKALAELCLEMSFALASDGEGVERVTHCRVNGASTRQMAKSVGASICNSPLVKTMVTGSDPNWGRIIMAIGKVQDQPKLANCQPSIRLCGSKIMSKGKPSKVDLVKLSKEMKKRKLIPIDIDLHLGKQQNNYIGTDLTRGYVDINADYTT